MTFDFPDFPDLVRPWEDEDEDDYDKGD